MNAMNKPRVVGVQMCKLGHLVVSCIARLPDDIYDANTGPIGVYRHLRPRRAGCGPLSLVSFQKFLEGVEHVSDRQTNGPTDLGKDRL